MYTDANCIVFLCIWKGVGYKHNTFNQGLENFKPNNLRTLTSFWNHNDFEHIKGVWFEEDLKISFKIKLLQSLEPRGIYAQV